MGETLVQGHAVGASKRRRIAWTTFFVFANTTALLVELIAVLGYYDAHESTNYLVPQDIWGPFFYLVVGQALVNGIVLTLPKRTRSLGVGVFLGTIGFVAVVFAFLAFVLAPALGD